MVFQRYPLLRAFLALCAGIMGYHLFPMPYIFWLYTCGITVILSLCCGFSPAIFGRYRWRFLFGIVVFALFFALGNLLYALYLKHPPAHELSSFQGTFLLRLEDNPVHKGKSYRSNATLLYAPALPNDLQGGERLKLYFEEGAKVRQLQQGSCLVFRGSITPPPGALNPGQFDYRAYLARQNIYYQTYLPENSWRPMPEIHHYRWWREPMLWQRKLLNIMDGWHMAEREKGIGKALLLGYRSDMDDDLRQSYAAAGATHVLAVSGLHVGIVYLLSFHLLFFLRHSHRQRIMRSIVLLALLWLYAALTGFSPSVVRAASMFSFVALGTAFHRHTSIYNTLLASAILLLLLRPVYLFDVGFQLSYLAVFGIVWLQPKIETLWPTRHFLLRHIWAICGVSLAAQLATFPLSLYYFHQFPGLFLLSNLLIIPLIAILMYAGISALLFSALQWPSFYLVKAFGFMLSYMNAAVEFIEGAEQLILRDIDLHWGEVVLLYFFMVFGIRWLWVGRYRNIMVSLITLISLGLWQLGENEKIAHSSETIILAHPEHLIICHRRGGQAALWSNATAPDTAALYYSLQPYLSMNNVDSIFWPARSGRSAHLILGGHLCWHYRNPKPYRGPATIFLAPSHTAPPAERNSAISAVVIYGTPRQNLLKDWQRWCERSGAQLIVPARDGAYFLSRL